MIANIPSKNVNINASHSFARAIMNDTDKNKHMSHSAASGCKHSTTENKLYNDEIFSYIKQRFILLYLNNYNSLYANGQFHAKVEIFENFQIKNLQTN